VSFDLPIGTIWDSPASPPNDGGEWKLTDGSEVSRAEYPELCAVLRGMFGEGDGETTVNLPDLRRRGGGWIKVGEKRQ
jgi:microcystin-dependent protein